MGRSVSGARADNKAVVIGAGIIGIACAHYLNDAGYDVTVVDKGAVAGACSSENCGHILPSHILPLNSPSALRAGLASLFDAASPFKVKLRPNASFFHWMTQFVRHCSGRHIKYAAANLKALLDSSFAEYEELAKTPGFDCEWRQKGLFYLFKESKNLNAFAKLDAMLRDEFGVEATSLDADQLEDADLNVRSGLAGGFFYSQDASLNPELLGRVWSQALEAKGVTFVEGCSFSGLERDSRRVIALHTSKGVFDVDHVVLAVGAMSRALSREFGRTLPVEPGKGYALTFESPDRCPNTPIVLPEKSIAITPLGGGLRIGSVMEFVGYDSTIPTHRIDYLKKGVSHYLHTALDDAPAQTWFGWRPMTWDSLPIIGRFPDLDNAYAATGHQMIGVMAAPGTGKLLADIVTGRAPHIPDTPYSVARFNV